MTQPELPYAPPDGTYLGAYVVDVAPMTRNVYGRNRQSVQDWLAALEAAAKAVAAEIEWHEDDRYAVAIEVRIPWRADIDNYVKDILDRSARHGVFGGEDERVDLVHAIKRSQVPASDAGARVELWRIGSDG